MRIDERVKMGKMAVILRRAKISRLNEGFAKKRVYAAKKIGVFEISAQTV